MSSKLFLFCFKILCNDFLNVWRGHENEDGGIPCLVLFSVLFSLLWGWPEGGRWQQPSAVHAQPRHQRRVYVWRHSSRAGGGGGVVGPVFQRHRAQEWRVLHLLRHWARRRRPTHQPLQVQGEEKNRFVRNQSFPRLIPKRKANERNKVTVECQSKSKSLLSYYVSNRRKLIHWGVEPYGLNWNYGLRVIVYSLRFQGTVWKNKTRTSKVGAISKAQKAQKKIFLEKNMNFWKKISFKKSRIVPKNVKRGTLCDVLTYIQLQNMKKLEGGTLLEQ